MRRLMSLTLAAGLCSVGFLGCAEKSSTTTETKTETPNGETKVTTEKTVEQSGDAPPPATNP
jgi:hypothetical protein